MKGLIGSLGVIGSGVLLGMGLIIGVNIGMAVLRLAAPHISRLQTHERK
ncbi:MAG: hypothetical protein ACM3SR_08430 [Ignavibacteriales bacterium]